MNYTAHTSAIVDEGASIGEGTRIWHFVHVCSKAKIGKNCSLGQNVFVGNDVSIGDNVKIQNNVSIYDSVEIENNVFCGPSMVFTNVINPRSLIVRKNEYKKTIVREGSSIGANATIICGVELGRFSFIAAGAVVTKNVLPYSLVAGIPAKHKNWMCSCGYSLPKSDSKNKSTCTDCGSTYKITSNTCVPMEN